MSTYWFLECKTCGEDAGEEYNHADDWMRRLVTLAPHIKALKDADTQGDLDIQVGFYGSSYPEFVVRHLGHRIVLCNEYGKEEVLTHALETTAAGGRPDEAGDHQGDDAGEA